MSISYADDEEIDHVVDSIQKRCAHVKRIEHIGIHSVNRKFQIETCQTDFFLFRFLFI
jgi:hypothetical protein